MALAITKDGEVAINNYKYKLLEPLTELHLESTPAKVNIGPDNYKILNRISQWSIGDLRGGILINDMDESVHADRIWWTNCITDYKNHITLPRLATSISPPSSYPSVTDPGLEAWDDANTLTNWTYYESHPACTIDRESTTVDSGTYSCRLYAGANPSYCHIYQAATNWSNDLRGTTVNIKVRVYNQNIANGKGQVIINDGVDSTTANSTGSGSWETITCTHTFNAAATQFVIYLKALYVGGASYVYFDYSTLPTISSGLSKAANFNGNLYWSLGGCLLKLASDRSSIDIIAAFPADITALIPSLNSKLYIYLGDSYEYFYMDTDESVTESDSANAYWGIQWGDELWKLKSDGTFSASSDPDGGAPTWSDEGDITDIASQIEGLLVGRDADGNTQIYCPTNSILKVYDDANTKWLDTEVKLGNHPNGGKGHAYWNGAIYLSYGLGVKKYVPESGSVTDVGLNRDDSLPIEYNGEIVAFCPDSDYDMFALVDASQTSGDSKSGLYAWNGMAWRCFWIDTNNNGAMHSAIVSSASSSYAVYWDCGGAIYYIDILRGLANPTQLSTQTYQSSGILLTPWFDAGNIAHDKMIKSIVTWASDVDSDETITIKYRIDKANNDLDTGWTSLVELNSSGENGRVETEFASGAGIEFNTIQFRIDFARGSTTTNTPDLHSLVALYRILTGADDNRAWNMHIRIAGGIFGTSAKEKYDDIWGAVVSKTLVPFIFRADATNETHYVQLFFNSGHTQTGRNYLGDMSLTAVEL